MYWLFALAIVAGGIMRALYYQQTSNKLLQILSFFVPFDLGIMFWIMLFETRNHVSFFNTYVKGLEFSGQDAARWILILGTACMITSVSWGVGAIISVVINSAKK